MTIAGLCNDIASCNVRLKTIRENRVYRNFHHGHLRIEEKSTDKNLYGQKQFIERDYNWMVIIKRSRTFICTRQYKDGDIAFRCYTLCLKRRANVFFAQLNMKQFNKNWYVLEETLNKTIQKVHTSPNKVCATLESLKWQPLTQYLWAIHKHFNESLNIYRNTTSSWRLKNCQTCSRSHHLYSLHHMLEVTATSTNAST